MIHVGRKGSTGTFVFSLRESRTELYLKYRSFNQK